jgi:hypothetical protein
MKEIEQQKEYVQELDEKIKQKSVKEKWNEERKEKIYKKFIYNLNKMFYEWF